MSTAAAWRIFELGFRPWMATRVRVHLTGLPTGVASGAPILLVCNHESFWDGFLMRAVQRGMRPTGSFHAVMLERELGRRPYLKLLGAIGLTPGSLSSGRRLLRTLTSLDQDATLAYFPQGKLRPGSPLPLGFRRGVEHVSRALRPVAVIPVGIRLFPGRTARTEAYVSVGGPLPGSGTAPASAALLEEAVTEQLRAIDDFLARHGEEAPESWPGPTERLPSNTHTPAFPDDVPAWLSRN